MNSSLLFSLMSLIVPILIAIGAYSTAKKKNRNPWLWFLIYFLTDFLGLIVICCSKTLDYNEELDYVEDSDVLGWVMLPISLIWFAITVYNSYYAAKSYHDAMIFDTMMKFMQ